MADASNPIMMIGMDDSEHSFYALDWTLEHFYAPTCKSTFKLIIVHARPPPASVLGVAGPGSVDVLPVLDADLKKSASKTIQMAKDMVASKNVADVQFEVVEGDPRNVMIESAEKFHASMLVLGSHGYGVVKRAVLGSVSDYCAHHAHCSVMIVKKPKTKR